MSNWLNDMNLFVAVAKTKSFSKAATMLDMPHSTLSRRITLLEKTLGLRLLHRTTRRVELTEDGMAYLDRVERVVEEANEIHLALIERSTEPQGHLRISLPPSLGGDQMGIWLGEFAQQYPKVSMDIDTSPVQVDVIAEKFDVAFRVGQLVDSNLIARKIALLQPYLVATPAYIKSKGVPKDPEDLLSHECLRLSGTPRETRWHLTKEGKRISMLVNGRFWFNDPAFGLMLAKEGMGIASVIRSLCQKELTSGTLVRVLPDWALDPFSIFAITPDKLLSAKTRAFIDFIADKWTSLSQK